jgi:hypothetical protein
MAKKKATTSSPKKDYHKPRKVKLADGTEIQEDYPKQSFTKSVYPVPMADPEKQKAPKDVAAKHKFPPPKKNIVFRQKWLRFIDGIVARENFKVGHLESLEILCDLYVEYEQLSKVVRTSGQTYEVVSRLGKTIKIRPEVLQLEKVKSNIRSYTKQLDLFPKKDHSVESGGDKDDWD